MTKILKITLLGSSITLALLGAASAQFAVPYNSGPGYATGAQEAGVTAGRSVYRRMADPLRSERNHTLDNRNQRPQ
jgi:hypothetical protein